MSLIFELAAQPGVFAAGEYSYRGDRFSYQGQLDEEQARMASIMCRATTMSVHMQADILASFSPDCPLAPANGWVVRGPHFTVCVVKNVFCFMDNAHASLNEVAALMNGRLGNGPDELV